MWKCNRCSKHNYDMDCKCTSCGLSKIESNKRDDSDKALVSGAIAFVTDSTIAGALIGGSITGAIIGDLLDGDLFD